MKTKKSVIARPLWEYISILLRYNSYLPSILFFWRVGLYECPVIEALLVHYTVGVLFCSCLSFRLLLSVCYRTYYFLSSVELLGIGQICRYFCLFFVSSGLAYGYTGSGWVCFLCTYGGFCFLSRVFSDLLLYNLYLYVIHTLMRVMQIALYPTIR